METVDVPRRPGHLERHASPRPVALRTGLATGVPLSIVRPSSRRHSRRVFSPPSNDPHGDRGTPFLRATDPPSTEKPAPGPFGKALKLCDVCHVCKLDPANRFLTIVRRPVKTTLPSCHDWPLVGARHDSSDLCPKVAQFEPSSHHLRACGAGSRQAPG